MKICIIELYDGYRVSVCDESLIERMRGAYSDEIEGYSGSPLDIYRVFDDAFSYQTKEEALISAKTLDSIGGFDYNGLVVIDDFHYWTWDDVKEGAMNG